RLDAAAWDVSARNGLELLPAACESCPCRARDNSRPGCWHHGPWLAGAGTAVVSCATTPVDAIHPARASLACTQAPHCTVVRDPRFAVALPRALDRGSNGLFHRLRPPPPCHPAAALLTEDPATFRALKPPHKRACAPTCLFLIARLWSSSACRTRPEFCRAS